MAVNRFRDLLLRETSTRPAALMRIGLALLAWTRFAADLAPFAWHGVDQPLLSAAFFLTTTGMLVGLFSRLCTALAGLTLLWMVYVAGPAGVEPWIHHHITLLAHATFLLALTPCGGSYSVDRWRSVRAAARARRTPPPERGPDWGLTLIAVQVSVVYLSAAVDKCSWAFLSGERLQHIFQTLYWGADPVPLPGYAVLSAVAAWAVVGIELTLGIGLWFRRARPVLIPLGLAVHALYYLGLPVMTFSLTMAVLYLAFVDPGSVHGAIDRMEGHPPKGVPLDPTF